MQKSEIWLLVRRYFNTMSNVGIFQPDKAKVTFFQGQKTFKHGSNTQFSQAVTYKTSVAFRRKEEENGWFSQIHVISLLYLPTFFLSFLSFITVSGMTHKERNSPHMYCLSYTFSVRCPCLLFLVSHLVLLLAQSSLRLLAMESFDKEDALPLPNRN